MRVVEVVVLVAAVGLSAGLWRFFFGAKEASRAELRDGVQEVTVTVKGGYSPDRVEVRQGVPVRLVFDRQETGDCTSRVVVGADPEPAPEAADPDRYLHEPARS